MEQEQPYYGWWRIGLLDGVWGIRREEKEGGNSCRGKWYKLCPKFIRLLVPKINQVVLWLYQALDFFYQGPFGKGVGVMELFPDLNCLHVLEEVQEPMMAVTIPENGKRSLGALHVWRCLACLIPAHPGTNTIVLAGNIGGRGQGKGRAGWGERPQEPKGRQREKRRRKGE